MDKTKIVSAILEKLGEEFDARRSASKSTRSAGNDPESKSEGKYDTRSIEENYLADGLAKQAQAAAQAAAAYEKLRLDDFAPDEPIDLGALVEIEFANDKEWFFLGPAAGGIEIEHAGIIVTVVTPESPLGSQLLDRRTGDSIPALKARILSIV
jgi:transcription elongation GreA/GreB family factor